MTRQKQFTIIALVVGIACVVLVIAGLRLRDLPETIVSQNDLSSESNIMPVARDLDTPWAVAFVPGGDILVTERPGVLRRIGAVNETISVPGVVESSEGGLMGLALHPGFAKNHYLYLYFTDANSNSVWRFVYENGQLSSGETMLGDIPVGAVHDGGALAFGPDGKLYITTGDANVSQNAQDTNSLSGKILRINDNGSIPVDNPFANAVWSYGHRNPQGIAWDDSGRMWATEHGPSGLSTGYDEVNLIEKGANYGWPTITGNQTHAGMKSPVIQSGGSETWAPSGLAFANGNLYFAGLRGQTLYVAKINDDGSLTLDRKLSGQFGRLRAVVNHDEYLFVSTSNLDGRGSPRDGDDQILKIPPEIL